MALKIVDPPAEDTQTEIRAAASRERDETQKHVDGRVAGLVKRWTEAKHPKPENAPFDRMTVAKDDVAALKQIIRRATTLHKVRPVFFKDRKDANGTVTVKYTVAHLPAKTDGQPAANQPAANQPAPAGQR